jgi:hypothetical protein
MNGSTRTPTSVERAVARFCGRFSSAHPCAALCFFPGELNFTGAAFISFLVWWVSLTRREKEEVI